MTGPTLKVVEVSTDTVVGTIELTETGELTASPPEIQEMIEQMASARRASPQEAFEGLTFWSNGYLKIVPAES